MKYPWTLMLAVPLMACATASPTVADADYASFGERAYVDGLYVEPVALIEDSRCPIDARCVWAGRLRINARVITGADIPASAELMELTLGEPVQVADGALELVEATPLPETGKEIGKTQYRFKFRFNGGY